MHAPTCNVWWVPNEPAVAEAALRWADDEDRARAARLRRDVDRAAALIGGALRRFAVAAAAGVDPAAVRFERRCATCGATGHGRPVPAGRLADAAACSVTHAGGWVGVATTPGAPVGLDVEPLGRARGADGGVPDRAFSTAERLALRALRTADPTLPLRAWTAKEALLKASGLGLAVAPSDVQLTALDGADARRAPRLAHWPLPIAARDAQLAGADPDARHVATVAVLSPVRHLVAIADGTTLLA